MAILTKAQFIQQLKDPEVATIKRIIHLLRKTIKPYGRSIVSKQSTA